MTEKQNLKLCDSALSRDLFPSDYHCLGDNNNRPIKWMPLESINQNRYSRASDVVSIVFLYLAIFTVITFIVSLKSFMRIFDQIDMFGFARINTSTKYAILNNNEKIFISTKKY